ncbi:MAG: amylo-alpha-1,6-glucosidase [Vicinamibacteria bacterium]
MKMAGLVVWALAVATPAVSADPAGWIPRFDPGKSGLQLSQATRTGRFFDVTGRRSAAFGYEHRGMEVWAYPLKLVQDFELAFRLEGYPLAIDGADTAVWIDVRPEATVFTYSHAAFTVRQTVFAPQHEPAVAMLLDVESVLPLTVIGTFRPRLKLMWPAGLMTGNAGWDEKERVYSITEESHRFAAVVGCPGARDLSVMPYQEEPRDVPLRFEVAVPQDAARTHLLPIVLAGSVKGRDDAKATYDRVLATARSLYEGNVAYYRELGARTTRIETPDARLDDAFAWAKAGIDKGLVDNPLLGTGFVAGFRTSGDSERPGFAWHFGRDTLWTVPAVLAYGDFETARAGLDFLRKFQRADGKIPHEVSQAASLVPWFTDYKYPYESADATPLYVIAHAEHFAVTGDLSYLRASWPSIEKAWRFTAATDTDGNGLVENAPFGHGWTEGSPPYPPHEEIYLQGVWIEACRRLVSLAEQTGHAQLARQAGAFAARTRAAVEKTYWLEDRGFYAFATALPVPAKKYDAEPGPSRARRQARIEALRGRTLVDEDTVLPAVPLWWGTLDAARAESQIDHLGSASLATDWGARLISDRSELYDPLSYHYGSVWGLFTGWASVGAYRYRRPHVGDQALMANALLTYTGALGAVTELLSGDRFAPFGRSSHHQIWSQAMVVSPIVTGLFGVEAGDGGRRLTVAPQLPASWDRAALRNLTVGASRLDAAFERGPGTFTVRVTPLAGAFPETVAIAPALPLDARVTSVTSGGRAVPFTLRREGDVQRAFVALMPGRASGPQEVVFAFEGGTDVDVAIEAPRAGAVSESIRVLRVRPDADVLRLVVEGRAGRSYALRVRTARTVGAVDGVTVAPVPGGASLGIAFEGEAGAYVRREIALPLR